MRLLSHNEVSKISGGSVADEAKRAKMPDDAVVAFGAVATIGGLAFGTGWGAVAVGTAIAGAPVAVVAMAGLAVYGAYSYASSRLTR